MSEKAKFYNMTKPMRFRRWRVFAKSVGLTYEVGKEKIKYLINYILYKLNIYKRHTYNDCVVKDCTESLLAPIMRKDSKLFCKFVNSDHISAHVKMTIESETHINQDYFYVMRKGEKVRKYVVIDREEVHYKLTGSLDNIGIRISKEESYHFTNLPIYRIAKEPVCRPFIGDVNEPLKPVECDVYEIDLSGLRSACVSRLIDDKALIPHIVSTIYCRMVDEFQVYLDSLTFRDLLVKR